MKNTRSLEKRIAIFIGFSLLWSLIWFSRKHRLLNADIEVPALYLLFLGLIPTLGLVIGSFVLGEKRTSNRIFSAGGKKKVQAIIFSIPILCVTSIGIENNFAIN